MKNLILILILIGIFLSSCGPEQSENCHRSATVYNNTSKRIYLLTSVAYPDTTFYQFNPLLNPDSKAESFQANTKIIDSPGGCVESIYNPNGSLKQGVLILYVFDGEVLETTPWETVIENNMYLKRYDLTLLDLYANNFTIVYSED